MISPVSVSNQSLEFIGVSHLSTTLLIYVSFVEHIDLYGGGISLSRHVENTFKTFLKGGFRL